jgi:hypothetical protein
MVAFHSFDVSFALRRFAPRRIFFGMKKRPGSAILDRGSTVVIMLENSSGQIFRVAHVETARGLAP